MLQRILQLLVLLPIQLSLLMLLTLASLSAFLFGYRKRPDETRHSEPAPGATSLVSIVVLNWNGRHLLMECLPALIRAVEFTEQPHEILVVDNGSNDGSVNWLRLEYPGIRIVELSENLGFGEGNNRGVLAAQNDVVLLLNNDMVVEPDFLPPLLRPFSDPEVFAVSSQIFLPAEKRREETGNTSGHLRFGRLELSHAPLTSHHQSSPMASVLWAGGGSSAFHRSRFLALGGFSELFSPCYLEDTDLSYRAWRRGWKVLMAPDSHVLHKHRSSSQKRFELDEIERLIEAHKLIYLWKNCQLKTLIGHLFWLPCHLSGSIPGQSYIGALRRLPGIVASRGREPIRYFSDRQLLTQPMDVPAPYRAPLPEKAQPSMGERKRLLFVSAYPPHLGSHGGAGRVFQLLSRVAQTHDVSLISFLESGESAALVEQLLPFCQRIELVRREAFQPVSLFPYEPFEEFNCQNFRERLKQILSETSFDLVHFEWTQMAQYADLFEGTPLLMTEIEVNYEALLSEVRVLAPGWRKLKRYYDSLQTLYRELQLCGKVHHVICTTGEDRDYLTRYLDTGKFSVVNTGVNTEYFSEPETDGAEKTLVFVGAFRHSPNVDAMLFFCERILPLVRKQVPGVRFFIVGSSPPETIRALANDHIQVTGFVEDIRPYYHMAQVVVVPLRTGVGIRGKILEAWSSARAVVATPLACQGLHAKDGSNLLIAAEPEAFAQATIRLLTDSDMRRSLETAGRETAVTHYQWDKLANQLTDLYQDILQAESAGLPSRSLALARQPG